MPLNINALFLTQTMEGFSIAQELDKLGLRSSPTGELVFEDVKVPGKLTHTKL